MHQDILLSIPGLEQLNVYIKYYIKDQGKIYV